VSEKLPTGIFWKLGFAEKEKKKEGGKKNSSNWKKKNINKYIGL